ncbi:uncharacterized protein LOC103706202 [Phoenix dactylifera]|uniref:Uncharacterized protein LOC103706202 n=1 Tax=Phoenix dactylifera TaxID=42345 RepID=A0A8B7BZE1_PHODC|nr:uncharacterized protein LOC103706202 [Phoenix dactylifera]
MPSLTSLPLDSKQEGMEFLASLILSSLLLSPPAQATTPSGTIQRTTKQQILASIPPGTHENTVPFITSPSGKYTAYLLRRETAPDAGGFGNDFCYIQVQDTSTEQSMWESECAPVSTANTCAVVFSDNGLEVFDGSNSAWATEHAESADENFLETLELVDEGDLWIRDKTGELAWKASEDPRANQGCGLPGSPGLAPARPPFAAPVGGDDNLPFGQQSQGGQQQLPQPSTLSTRQAEPSAGVSQAFGFGGSNPLGDNIPYDSGSSRGFQYWLGTAVALHLAHLAYGIF